MLHVSKSGADEEAECRNSHAPYLHAAHAFVYTFSCGNEMSSRNFPSLLQPYARIFQQAFKIFALLLARA
jgi:hypothetical protein